MTATAPEVIATVFDESSEHVPAPVIAQLRALADDDRWSSGEILAAVERAAAEEARRPQGQEPLG